MIPKTIGSYGAPFADAEPVEDPTTQVSSALYNRSRDDLAQTTRAVMRAWVSFLSDPVVVAPAPIAVSDATSVWGDAASANPTITKTATGIYEVQWAASYIDGLGETEVVNLRFAGASLGAGGIPYGFARTELTAANTVVVNLGDLGGFDDDLGGKLITVWAR